MKRPLAYPLIPLLACVLFGSWAGQPAAQSAAPEIYLARLEGVVDGQAAAYAQRVISEAEDTGAGVVVLELDTPGGTLSSMQEIVEAESNAGDVAVVTYVSPRGAPSSCVPSISAVLRTCDPL